MMQTGGQLQFPGPIDAHLLNAAMDGAQISLLVNNTRLDGKLDLADGFGQIAFLPNTPLSESLEAGTSVEVKYTYKGRVWWFCARLFDRSRRNRWALLRPMRVFYRKSAE